MIEKNFGARMPISRNVVLAVLPLFNLRLAAASAPLTWTEAVRETAQRNPDLAAERASVSAAEAQYRAAFASFLPSISGNLDVSRGDSQTSTPSTTYDASLSGRYNLFNGLADQALLAQRRANLDEAKARYNDIASDVSQQLLSAFARLLFAQDQLSLSVAIADRRRENLRLVELRYEGGRENKGSYLRTKADYHSSLYDVNQSSRTLRIAKREMSRVVGQGDFEMIVASGTLEADRHVLTEPLPDFETLALQTPAYRQADAQTRAAHAGITTAASGFSPTLDTSALGGRFASTWPPERDRWSVGASLSIPIFSGGATFQELRRAQAQRDRARFAQSSAATLLARQLEEAHAALANAVENVAAQDEYEQAAYVRAQIARGQYGNGLISFFDWDGIENELIQRQRSRLAAWRDALLADAAWQNTRGTGAFNE